MLKKSTFLVFFCLLTLSAQAQMSVTDATTAPYNNLQNLIKNNLTGDGIELLEVVYMGESSATGFFTEGDSAIQLSRGLILTTGSAASNGSTFGANGMGVNFATYQNGNINSISVLSQIASGPVYDHTIFKIRFKPLSDSIRFRYVFASEEYPEYACSQFNDVFGFFLSGPNPNGALYANFNIALIPGTNLPVSINNLHPFNAINGNCPPLNVQYYHDNNQQARQPVYDGFTDVFIAEAAVTPCAEYEMYIAIGDVSDGIYDSGVFLEANSFFSRPLLTNGFESGLNIIPESATAKATTIQLNQLPAVLLPVEIILGGTATNGIDYTADVPLGLIYNPDTTLTLSFQPIPDSLIEGLETIEVIVKGQDCFERTFVLSLADPDSLTNDSLIVVYPELLGDSVLLLAAPTYLSGKTWTFANNTAKAIAPAFTQVTSDILVSGIPIDLISDKNVVESVLINIEHGWDDDLDIYLLAPGDKFMELSTDNGLSGDNYTNTCFKPTATVSITGGQVFAPASAAPFTGAYQPEGMWSDLKGAHVNGTWKLSIMDDAIAQQGTLLNWSISIKGALLGNYTYLWSTGDTTPYLKVVLPGTYKVKIENQVSVLEKTFLVLPLAVYSQVPLYACPGNSVTYQGVTFNASHPADTFTYQLPSGADSTVFVQFQEYPSTQDTLVVILQSGETFTFNGMELGSAGDYTFVLTNQFGCDSTIVVDVNILLGTNNLKDAAEVRIVPQPLKDQAQVLLNPEWSFNTLLIYASTGQLVHQQNVTQGASAITIDLARQPKGVYTLVLEGPLGRVATSFIKQ